MYVWFPLCLYCLWFAEPLGSELIFFSKILKNYWKLSSSLSSFLWYTNYMCYIINFVPKVLDARTHFYWISFSLCVLCWEMSIDLSSGSVILSLMYSYCFEAHKIIPYFFISSILLNPFISFTSLLKFSISSYMWTFPTRSFNIFFHTYFEIIMC